MCNFLQIFKEWRQQRRLTDPGYLLELQIADLHRNPPPPCRRPPSDDYSLPSSPARVSSYARRNVQERQNAEAMRQLNANIISTYIGPGG
jgi:hypothetical protein